MSPDWLSLVQAEDRLGRPTTAEWELVPDVLRVLGVADPLDKIGPPPAASAVLVGTEVWGHGDRREGDPWRDAGLLRRGRSPSRDDEARPHLCPVHGVPFSCRERREGGDRESGVAIGVAELCGLDSEPDVFVVRGFVPTLGHEPIRGLIRVGDERPDELPSDELLRLWARHPPVEVHQPLD